MAATAGCGRSAPSTEPAAAAPRVRTVRPVERDVIDYAYFTGRTGAVESVEVQSRVTGYLDSVDFRPGTEVKAGSRLMKIDPRPYQAALDQAEGQVRLAEARLELAEADYRRALEVAKTPGAISQQDIDRYAAARSEATASVAAAKANCELARLNVEFTDVLAPVDGIVGRNLLTVGNLVKQDTTLLTTVVSQDPMYVYFDVDERTMLRVLRLIEKGEMPTVGDDRAVPVEIGLADEDAEYPHEGRIDFVNNQVDASTGTIQVRGEFANPAVRPGGPRLLTPGMFVRVRLPIGGPHRALVVPRAALCTDQGRKYLLVVGGGGLVEYRPVALGPEQPGGLQVVLPLPMIRAPEGLREAREGEANAVPSLAAADRVIVGGLLRARPGERVEARDESGGNQAR